MGLPNPGQVENIQTADGRGLFLAWVRLSDRDIEYRIHCPATTTLAKVAPAAGPVDTLYYWHVIYTMKTSDQDHAILDGIRDVLLRNPGILKITGLTEEDILRAVVNDAQLG